MTTPLRRRWESIPGVTYAPENSTSATPPRNKRTPAPARSERSRRPRSYRLHPDTYTARGTRRIHPIGKPAAAGWITAAQALNMLGISHSSLSRYTKTRDLSTCCYSAPDHPNAAKKYYRIEEILCLRSSLRCKRNTSPKN